MSIKVRTHNHSRIHTRLCKGSVLRHSGRLSARTSKTDLTSKLTKPGSSWGFVSSPSTELVMVPSDMVKACGSASIGMFYAKKNWWKEKR